MRTVAIVQARLSSSRLPAKVLLDLGGVTALEACLTRVRRIPRVDEVVVATSAAPSDDVLENAVRRLGYRVFRGSELDVLSRYAGAAREADADVVIRCTSDCPLIDPAVSGLVLDAALGGSFDYVSNVMTRRLPRGLDTEVVLRSALDRADRDASDPSEREHVTMHVYRNRDRYRCGEALPSLVTDLSKHRWTLDTLDDYRFLALLFEQLGDRAKDAGFEEVLAVCDAHPELVAINAAVQQKTT